jgi:geranylgeranyl pyrophosphate synthase
MNTPALALEWDHQLQSDMDRTIAEALGYVESPALREILVQSTVGGKRVRPLLTVLACAAAGGREQDALPAAAALEILHASSLVHDDIMDRSELRRGAPTVHAKHGTPMAVLAGDALIAVAYRALQNLQTKSLSEIILTFSSCFLALCEGQCADIECPDGTLNDPTQHKWMVERKTARLVEACTRIGALVATADRRVVDVLGKYGLHLGLAYQAMDDLLDATADEAVLGKSVGTDARNGRHTYLTLVYPAADLHSAAQSVVAHHTAEALSALDELPPSEARDRLRDLAHVLLERRS